MDLRDVTFCLPPDRVAGLNALALERDEPVNDLVRGRLDREVARLRSARAARRTEAPRIERLWHLLAPALARATGWADLQARLALYGVAFRAGRGGPMLHDHITAEALCSSAALGFGDTALARRFAGPLPEGAVAATMRMAPVAAGLAFTA